MKLFLLFLLYIILLTSNLFSSSQENPTLKKILELYKRKDFKEISRLANDYIQKSEELSQDDKVLKFYFHTESDIRKLDSILDTIYKNTDEVNSKFHILTYMLMEKALLVDEYEIGVKWGDIFRKEAKAKKQRYVKGMYLYSCLLYKAERPLISLSVIDMALKEKPSQKMAEKLKLLRIAQLKNDFQIIVETKNFLKNNYDSNYSDVVFTYMIQSYRNVGKQKRVKELKDEFKKDFGDSPLLEKVTGI
ncbi:MAG: hypothetical protein IPL26_07580 [Leptospiraceae bacterium]|nr:hypothetical protein [Leptospiraceae bacterium]